MAKIKKSEEKLPDFSYPPFVKDTVYCNRNFGKFKVVDVNEKTIKYEMLDNPGSVVESEHCGVFENICRNTYFENWKKLNGVKQRLSDLKD